MKEKTSTSFQSNNNKKYFRLVRKKTWTSAGRVTENFMQ